MREDIGATLSVAGSHDREIESRLRRRLLPNYGRGRRRSRRIAHLPLFISGGKAWSMKTALPFYLRIKNITHHCRQTNPYLDSFNSTRCHLDPVESNFEAILFDVDGTLLDSIEDLTDSMNSTLSHFGFPTHEVERYKYFVGDGMENLVRRALPDSAETDSAIVSESLQMMRQTYDRN